MTHRRIFLRITAVLGLAALVGSGGARAQTIDGQVALSIELLELSVGEWTERNAAAAGEGDEAAKAAAMEAVKAKYGRERAERYRNYSTSAPEHLAFFAKHAAEVEEYLNDHPEIKGRIDELNQTLRNLIVAGESAGSANAEAAQ